MALPVLDAVISSRCKAANHRQEWWHFRRSTCILASLLQVDDFNAWKMILHVGDNQKINFPSGFRSSECQLVARSRASEALVMACARLFRAQALRKGCAGRGWGSEALACAGKRQVRTCGWYIKIDLDAVRLSSGPRGGRQLIRTSTSVFSPASPMPLSPAPPRPHRSFNAEKCTGCSETSDFRAEKGNGTTNLCLRLEQARATAYCGPRAKVWLLGSRQHV